MMKITFLVKKFLMKRLKIIYQRQFKIFNQLSKKVLILLNIINIKA
jgi:hypothetical protein